MASVASRALATALLLGCTLLHCNAEPETVLERTDGNCPANWLGPYRGTCYRLSDEKLSWDLANTEGCNNLAEGAYLASVTYSNQAYLSKQKAIMDSAYFWVGLRVGDDEWNNGTEVAEKVDFTNWDKVRFSQPDGHRITNDDCVLLLGKSAFPSVLKPGTWMDWDCDTRWAVTCELRQESDVECPESWTKHNGVCYLPYDDELMTYTDAEAYCVSKGATLLTEPDYAELSQSTPIGSLGPAWIGLRSTPDAAGVLRWRNADNTAVSETNWLFLEYEEPYFVDLNQPWNSCVAIIGTLSHEWYSPGFWGAVNCGFKVQYLCALKV